MMRAAKQRNQLGQLTKVGQGGQGVVYRTSAARTSFTDTMVYKEYKSDTRTDVDFTALAAMPALVEQSMPRQEGERLISIAAWPCELVEDAGMPTGFVMPEIPDAFTVTLTTMKGVSDGLAEFQHLLNPQAVLDARGIVIDEVQRYELLREVASAMAFLHSHAVCIGDVSPKNLLFSLKPRAAVYFVDCDGMRIDGMSVLPQMETPGWAVPAGEELATVYSDAYKLGLLALRLITGSQIANSADDLPTSTPPMLRQIVGDTLDSTPEKRPLPATWSYVVGHAIEEAQHRKKATCTGPRPEKSISASQKPVATPAASVPPPQGMSDNSTSSTGSLSLTGKALGLLVAGVVGLGLVIALVTIIVTVNDAGSESSSLMTSSRTRTSFYANPAPSTQPAYTQQISPQQATTPRIPPDATPCSSHLDGSGYKPGNAAIGNSHTSCEFAVVVLQRYIGQGQRGPSVILDQVYSPVTKKYYSMTCNGSKFVVCTGGIDAVVYLY